MKKAFLVLAFLLAAFALGACDTSSLIVVATPASSDTLTDLLNSQDRATAAAQQYQNVSAKATTIAEATRQFLVLQGYQTRIAMDNAATATSQSLSVQATQTAASANATRLAQNANATATAQSAQATATREIERANASATAQAAQYTATANAVIVQATQVSASATATANAANASATQVSAAAISTRTAEEVQTKSAQENWVRLTSGAWAITGVGVAVLVTLVTLWLVIRFVGARIFQMRQIQDPIRGNAVVTEPGILGLSGRYEVINPAMLPAPMVTIDSEVVKTHGGDPKFALRQTEVQMIAAAAQGNFADDVLEEVVQRGYGVRRIEPGDEQAQKVLPPKDVLDGDWRILNAGADEAG